jgi:hypothetical protein
MADAWRSLMPAERSSAGRPLSVAATVSGRMSDTIRRRDAVQGRDLHAARRRTSTMNYRLAPLTCLLASIGI